VDAKEFKMPSGAKLTVSVCPFADANALLKALLKSAKGIGVPKDLLQADVSVLKDVLISAATSDDVEAALFKCGSRASYQNVKVTAELFDDTNLGEIARKDYYSIWSKIVEVNCSPFFEQTFSALKARLSTPIDTRKSPSESTIPSS
jgi:hypothetical protein